MSHVPDFVLALASDDQLGTSVNEWKVPFCVKKKKVSVEVFGLALWLILIYCKHNLRTI